MGGIGARRGGQDVLACLHRPVLRLFIELMTSDPELVIIELMTSDRKLIFIELVTSDRKPICIERMTAAPSLQPCDCVLADCLRT